MKHLSLAALAIMMAGLAACAPAADPVEDDAMSSLAQEDVDVGVSYQGVVEEAGISIYMQGTHRLTMPGDRFVLLESEDVDLDAYLGKEVEVYGDARPTVEGDIRIVEVRDVSVLSEGSASSSEATSSQISSIASSEILSSVASSVTPASSRAASVARSLARNSVRASVAPSSVAPVSAVPESEEMVRARAMAKSNLAPANWTRQYCAPQFGFCLPIHKNWYYNSFGTTTSYLWHIEMSNEHPDAIGKGPLSVNLVSGAASTQGATDGQIVTKGEYVVGYREWENGNHFEIVAPAILDAAVRHITQELKEAPASSSSSTPTSASVSRSPASSTASSS